MVNESEHCERHGDKTDSDVTDCQVYDQQVASCSSLRVSHHNPTHTKVGYHSSYHQKAEKEEIKLFFETFLRRIIVKKVNVFRMASPLPILLQNPYYLSTT